MERGREALRKVGLEHFWDYYTLSVVKSLENPPESGFSAGHEPPDPHRRRATGGLDYATGEKVMEILLDLNRQGAPSS